MGWGASHLHGNIHHLDANISMQYYLSKVTNTKVIIDVSVSLEGQRGFLHTDPPYIGNSKDTFLKTYHGILDVLVESIPQ